MKPEPIIFQITSAGNQEINKYTHTPLNGIILPFIKAPGKASPVCQVLRDALQIDYYLHDVM